MSTMSASYIQRLQRLYMHFRKNARTLLGGCCALIELIDEDDLTNWYVLLRYEDENKAEFFVSLRIYFLEELQRMPLVFVIAPRLIAAFIHHGAICSLELMSQYWSVDAEGLSLLFRSLHATLNPFSHDTKVTVDEIGESRSRNDGSDPLLMGRGLDGSSPEAVTVSAYTREEHELGIQHIRQSHPHLFRSYAIDKQRLQPQKQQQRSDEELLATGAATTTTTTTEAVAAAAGAFVNGVAAPFFSTTTTTSSSSSSSPTACENSDEGGKASVKRVVVRSHDELRRLFLGGAVTTEVELDLRRTTSPSSLSSNDLVMDDDAVVTCTLPQARHLTPPYTMTLRPLQVVEDGTRSPAPKANEAASGQIQEEGLALPTCDTKDSVGDTLPVVETPNSSPSFQQRDTPGAAVLCSPSLPAFFPSNRKRNGSDNDGDGDGDRPLDLLQQSDPQEERQQETENGGRGIRRAATALILTGDPVFDRASEDLLPNTRMSRKPNASCVIPAGCTLRLHHLTVYAALTVLGTLEMHDCSFVGHFTTEGKGRVRLSRSDVYIDVPEARRDGILILDASTVEIFDGATVQRKEHTIPEEVESFPLGATAPFLLQAFILVSNSGSLRMRGGCHIVPYGTEKTIFAEQDASVDILDCDVVSGFSSAVSILGCRGSLTNTRLYGANHLEPQVSDTIRSTGLNVELGGVVTARHCLARHLYFGFSVIAHSVAHFYGCHADHVVNGYTIDASSVTIENSSAETNHVGVFVLNKAKCNIRNDTDYILSFEKRCRQILLSRRRSERQRVQIWCDDSLYGMHGGKKSGSGKESVREYSSSSSYGRTEPTTTKEGTDASTSNAGKTTCDDEKVVGVFGPLAAMFIGKLGEPTTLPCAEATVPLSFRGGLFNLEIRDAFMLAKGMVLADAQDTSIYVYDQGSLTLVDSIAWTTLASLQQPCGIKVVNSRAHVQRCLLMDYVFGFAAIQGSNVRFEECIPLGGTNGFTIDSAHCTLYHCGADTEHVGIFALNHSTLRMDNTNAPGYILGGLPCVLCGRVNGLESRSSDTICTGVLVQRGLDSGFTCYNGGCLVLERCVVDMSATASATSASTATAAAAAAAAADWVPFWGASRHLTSQMMLGWSNSSSSAYGVVASDAGGNARMDRVGSEGGGGRSGGGGAAAAAITATIFSGDVHAQSQSYILQKNSGVKAWSGSRCVVIGCEVRHVTFGYAAIGPGTELEVSHSTAKHIVNGFTVDSAKCRLSRCSTNSNHVGVFVLAHGTCTVRRGSYTARMYGIETRNGIVHVEGHVKLSGFSRIGLYVYDGARLDTTVDSKLDIRVRKDPTEQPLTLTGDSATPLALFPSCFAMNRGTAVIHNAIFGGGAQCAVSCGDGANAYLHQCTAEYCNVAFNALTGSQLYLSDCCAQHVRQHALIVHHGGVSRVTSQTSVLHGGGSFLQGKLQIDGNCFLDNVVLSPMPVCEREAHIAFPHHLETISRMSTSSSPLIEYSPMHGGLICITSCGALSMNMCLVLLEDEHCVVSQDGKVEKDNVEGNEEKAQKQQRREERGCGRQSGGGGVLCDETLKRAVITAEGRKAIVQLCDVVFQQLGREANGEGKNRNTSVSSSGSALQSRNSSCGTNGCGSKTTWLVLTLRQGARGEIRGVADATHSSTGGVSLIHGVMEASIDHHGGNPLTMRRLPSMTCVENGGTFAAAGEKAGGVGCGAPPYGSAKGWTRRSFGDAMVPLRVHVARASSLKVDNVHLRQLVASDGSNVSASHCFFAGAEAVLLTGGSTFRAVESVFVGAVRGPAVLAEHSTMSLIKCRGYYSHKEALFFRYTTVTLEECVLSAIFSSAANDGSESSLAGLSCLWPSGNVNGDAARGSAERCCCGDDRSSVAEEAGKEVAMIPRTAAPMTSPPVIGAVESRSLKSVGLSHLSCVYGDETQPESLGRCVRGGWQQSDSEADKPEAFLGLGRSGFIDRSLGWKKEVEVGANMEVGRCAEETTTPTLYLCNRNCCCVRLEHSRMYYCRVSRMEGGIAADAASRIELCRSWWFRDSMRAIREIGVRVALALFGMPQEQTKQ